MDHANTTGGRGRRGNRGHHGHHGRNRGRGHRGARDRQENANPATTNTPNPRNAIPNPHGNGTTSQAYHDLQEEYARITQQLDDAHDQLNQRLTELNNLDRSHADLTQHYSQLLEDFRLYREQHEAQITAMLANVENMSQEFSEKEDTMSRRMDDLYKALGKGRSFKHLEVTKYLEENADFFYELLSVQVNKTNVLGEALAALTKENAELRARLESLKGGASA
ncbi:hypothetical protein K449DRAFT_420848 [Hypoxylon sp. EC38]|nr:hypothetical protein K449DRAFT_420848 [Hypoxylon sp. EC38]